MRRIFKNRLDVPLKGIAPTHVILYLVCEPLPESCRYVPGRVTSKSQVCGYLKKHSWKYSFQSPLVPVSFGPATSAKNMSPYGLTNDKGQ